MKRHIFTILALQGILFSLEVGEQTLYEAAEETVHTETFGRPSYFGNCGEYFPQYDSQDPTQVNRHNFWNCNNQPLEVIPDTTFSPGSVNSQNCVSLQGEGQHIQYTGKCVDGYDTGSITEIASIPADKIGELHDIVYEEDPTRSFIRGFYDLNYNEASIDSAKIPLFDNSFRLDLDYTVTAPYNKEQYFVLSNVQTGGLFDIDRYDMANNYVYPVRVVPTSTENGGEQKILENGNLVCENGSIGPNLISPDGTSVMTDEGGVLTVDSSSPRYGCQKPNKVFRGKNTLMRFEPTVKSPGVKRSEAKRDMDMISLCQPGWEYVKGMCIEKEDRYLAKDCRDGFEFKQTNEGENLCVSCGVIQFENNDFDNGLEGWVTVTHQLHMDGSSELAGYPTMTDSDYPNNTPNTDYAAPSSPRSGIISEDTVPDDNGLQRTIVRLDTTDFSFNTSCGIYRNAAIYSEESVFFIEGSKVSVTWKSLGDGDAYDTFAYLVNERTGAKIQLINQYGAYDYDRYKGERTHWITTTVEIGAGQSGLYKFVFVAGTYDATCGRYVGGSLELDKIEVSFDAPVGHHDSGVYSVPDQSAASETSSTRTRSIEEDLRMASSEPKVEDNFKDYPIIEPVKPAKLVPSSNPPTLQANPAWTYIYDTPIWHPGLGCVNVKDNGTNYWEYVRDTSYEDDSYCFGGTIDARGQCVQRTEFFSEITVKRDMGGISRLCWDDYLEVYIEGVFADGSGQSKKLEFFNSRKTNYFDRIFIDENIVYSKNSPTINGIGVLEAAPNVVVNGSQNFKHCLYNQADSTDNILKYVNQGSPFIPQQSYKVSYKHRNLELIKKTGVLAITLNTDLTQDAFEGKYERQGVRFVGKCETGYYENANGECVLEFYRQKENKCQYDNSFYPQILDVYTERERVIAQTQAHVLGENDMVILEGRVYIYKKVSPYILGGVTYDFLWTDNPYNDGKSHAEDYFPR